MTLKNPIVGKLSAWLTSWSARVLSRCASRGNGIMVFQLFSGNKCSRPVARLGEVVQFKLRNKHTEKADTLWRKGVFLGMNNRSIDPMISTKEGMASARTARAKTESEAWNIEAIGAI